MTIAELIKNLQEYPEDTRVVIPGYEGGLTDVDTAEMTEIYLNYNDTWYYGKHEEVSTFCGNTEKYEKVSAIILN